jgi:cytidylate kinase
MRLRIAVDGPAGSGKSTISKIIAEKLNLIYIDTGAMYRACAYISVKYNKVGKDLIECVENTEIYFKKDVTGQRVFIKFDGETFDITEEIRSVEVTKKVSETSKIKEIRDIITRRQKSIAADNNVIMDGRDIGTVVIPDAEYKFFLEATPYERARRRYEEMVARGENIEFEEVLKDVKKRDFEDMNREIAPLKRAEDALLIDTTNKTIEDVVSFILNRVKGL